MPSMHQMTRGCLAGTGVCFISHQGEVFPCGYLPVEAGNVRQQHFGTIWEASPHSKSFAALTSPGAAANAQAMGVANPPEDPKCLTCHAPLFDKAAELKAEGVTCEVCHGPGSEYKKLSVMKNKDEAVKNGLVLYGSPDAIKAHCLKCHANAHGKSFDFAAFWDKIKHPIPGK